MPLFDDPTLDCQLDMDINAHDDAPSIYPWIVVPAERRGPFLDQLQ